MKHLFVGKSQLHYSCKTTTKTVKHFLPKWGKKWFKKGELACTFCKKKGHDNSFCPAAPHMPPLQDRIPFVEGLLAITRVKTDPFRGLSLEDALKKIETQGREWNAGNPWRDSSKIYDKLRAQLGYWRAMGAGDAVISWLGYGVPMKFIREPAHKAFPNHKMDAEGEAYMDKDMAKHTASGCFVPAPAGSVKVSNPILIIDQNGKKRRCDDCRHCNALQGSAKFRMCSLHQDVPMMAEPGDIAITEDLEKAYYKVPLAGSAQAYAAFFWRGVYYLSMVMLFGMCQAPFYFTRICKPIARLFGALKFPALSYIDDWFWSSAPDKVKRLHWFIEMFFSMLGWTFNAKGEKGECVHLLGFIVDMVRRKFVIPEEKRIAVLSMLQEHKLSQKTGRGVMMGPLRQTLGKVLSMSLAEPSVKTWCRSLYGQVVATEGEGCATLSRRSLEELDMLILLLRLTDGSPFVSPLHDAEIWVDAGEVGWGGHTVAHHVSGQFTAIWIGTSSTARELKGLALTIEAMAPQLAGKVVRLHMDSMCAVRNLMKGGGPVDVLCALVKEVWRICRKHKIELFPEWQSRDEPGMVRADILSKVGTLWLLLESFTSATRAQYGVEVTMPDVAKAKATVIRLLTSQQSAALVLPRWEGQTWWGMLHNHAKQLVPLEDMRLVVAPNDTHGMPRWDFVLCIF